MSILDEREYIYVRSEEVDEPSKEGKDMEVYRVLAADSDRALSVSGAGQVLTWRSTYHEDDGTHGQVEAE